MSDKEAKEETTKELLDVKPKTEEPKHPDNMGYEEYTEYMDKPTENKDDDVEIIEVEDNG